MQRARTGEGRQSWGKPATPRRVVGLVTVLLLGYCLVAALNARATYNPASATLEYHACIHWLPKSFDSRSTWNAFWTYLALAASFWAMVDWLPGGRRIDPVGTGGLPSRLAILLTLLATSGGLLAVAAIAQRIANSPKLLFLVTPEIHQSAETQLASFAYRANGAQYFNLLWPVCLCYWWTLRRSDRFGAFRKNLPLVSAGIMAACPLLSGARGAALADVGMLVLATLALLIEAYREPLRTERKSRPAMQVVCSVTLVLAFGLGFGWRQLRPRLTRIHMDLQQREEIYAKAARAAQEYPLLGTGAGTFERVFELYRSSAEEAWPAQLHNDWLETRMTFGWLGSVLIGVGLAAIAWRPLLPGGLPLNPQLVLSLWLSLTGCLVQARWDFPLQVYSILFLFLTWCAVLCSISRQPPL